MLLQRLKMRADVTVHKYEFGSQGTQISECRIRAVGMSKQVKARLR